MSCFLLIDFVALTSQENICMIDVTIVKIEFPLLKYY